MKQTQTLFQHFSMLEDPRAGPLHNLHEIVIMAICGIICGAETWVDVEEFGEDREEWLRSVLHLELAHGIPSHDTFGRLFSILDAKQFELCFLQWIQEISEVSRGEVIAIDGKCIEGSRRKRIGKRAITMVNAWASQQKLVLAQEKVDRKSNEIAAIPTLLEKLHLEGCLVTIDAMGCQEAVAEKIVQEKGDYLLALKGNQGAWYDAVAFMFQEAQSEGSSIICSYEETLDKDHGRVERRRCWATEELGLVERVSGKKMWHSVKSIVMVEHKRVTHEKTTIEIRYYLSSCPANAKRQLGASRTHWQVENSVHWVLDVAFGEDNCRAHEGHSAENFAVLRRIAFNLIKQEATSKRSMKGKRLKAGWSSSYLEKVLNC
jgi:predicted transposase YbfD/YdcC